MATQTICDGCGTPLYKVSASREENGGVTSATGRELLIEGTRANGMQGADPLPSGKFTWCLDCSRIAFRAVRDANLQKRGWVQ